LNKFYGATEQDVESAFTAADRNSDGGIDKDEFYQAVCELAISVSRHESDAVFEHMDENKNGSLDIGEFKRLFVFESAISLVVPGQILFVYAEGGRLNATCGNFESLKPQLSLLRITVEAAEDHNLRRYLGALRSLRNLGEPLRAYSKPREKLQVSITDAKCSICDTDPTWPYICKTSEASKALVFQTCTLCQNICCVVCASAGDQISGEVLGQVEELPDNRIYLPSISRFDPQRVCLICFLDSYSH